MIRSVLDAEPDKTLWPAIKCREIVKAVQSLDRTTRAKGLEIQIVDVIHRGGNFIEVLVRAWQDGNQIGFGKDGSVDVERVRIFSPPIYARDPLGDYERVYIDPDDGVRYSWRFREDPLEALLQDLEHTIKVKQEKFVGSPNIVRGRVGNTTSTFFSGPGDGFITSPLNASWDTSHDAADGVATDYTGTVLRVSTGKDSSGNFAINRAFFPFDTSALPDTDTVSSATFSAFCTATTSNGDNDGDDFFVPVGSTTQADPTQLVNADYDQCGAVNSPTEFSDSRIDFGSFSAGSYEDWTLNAAGKAAVSKTGYTLIGLREGHDIIDSPYAGADNTSNQLRFSQSEEALTTQDPKLVVEHAVVTQPGWAGNMGGWW